MNAEMAQWLQKRAILLEEETHVQSNRHKSHLQCQVLSAQGGNEYRKPRSCEEIEWWVAFAEI